MAETSQDRLGRELYDASRDGNVERVAHLLGKGASVYWTDGASQTALHMVCYHSNQPDVVKLLLRNNRSINYQTSFSNTPLHYACIQGHLASVKLLLATGQCNLGIVNSNKRTPLEEAVDRNKRNIVYYLELITAHGVDVSGPGLLKRLLEVSVLQSDMEFLKYLFNNKKVDVNAPVTKSGDSMLVLSVREGKLDVVKFFVSELGVDVNTPVTKSGDSMVVLSVREGKLDVIIYFVSELGVDVNTPVTKSGDSMVVLSVREGKLDVIIYFVSELGVDVNTPVTKSGDSMVVLSVREGKLDVIIYFVSELGVDVNAPVTKSGDSMLVLSVREGNLDVIKYFVSELGVDINAPVTKSGDSMLVLSVCEGKLDVIKYFVSELRVDVNTPVTKSGDSMLVLSVCEGKLDVIKYFVSELRVDVNTPVTKSGDSMLVLSVREGNLDVIKYFVSELGVDINAPVTKSGDSMLVLSVRVGKLDVIKYFLSELGMDVNTPVTKSGDSMLVLSVCEGKLDVIKYFVSEQCVDVNAPLTKSGDTILGLAVHKSQFDTTKYLVTECSVSVNDSSLSRQIQNLAVDRGDLDFLKYLVNNLHVDIDDPKLLRSTLELTTVKGDVDLLKYLISNQGVDVNDPLTKGEDTLLDLVIREGKLVIVKCLVTECSVNIYALVTKTGDTLPNIAVCSGDLPTIQYLVMECSVKLKEQHLLLACEHQQAAVVQYLLTTNHINPNIKDDHERTPLSLAKNKDVIKLLIQHGADAENVYALHRKVMNNVFSKDPVKNPVKMFVIGHGGEGKSTLIEAMEHEPTAWTSLVNIFIPPKEVEGVDQRTAGIIPRVFKSHYYGQVLFYDFAGQEAYYSSHAAIIKSTVDTCPPVFLLVINLQKNQTAITHSVSYWLGIITNQCGNMDGKAPLIVIGSHADLVETVEIDSKKQIISQAVTKYISFDLVDVISMDCRYSNSDGMKILRRCVGTSCNFLRSKLSVSLNSHMFLIYLIEKHSLELAVTLEKVQSVLKLDIDQKLSKKHKELVPFIPTTIPHLVEICVQLSDKGHILFLLNETSPEKSFIIIDKTALLAEINGTLFAPKDFKQHCQLATSTGVVPQSKLAEQFQKFNITMLVKFLSHLELAVPIEDQQVLLLINQHVGGDGLEKYLFCPALIRLEGLSEAFEYQEGHLYHFGWILSSPRSDHFLDARFLHVCLLRLALSLGLAPVIDPEIPALQHQCSVWKTGVCWNTPQGAEILVEVANKKKVVFFIQSKVVTVELLETQCTVLKKVREAASELCPTVVTEEFLILPKDMAYPLTLSSSTPMFSLKSVAESIVQQYPYVVSVDGNKHLPVSSYEVYAYLGKTMLQTLFTSAQDTVISDKFLSNLCSCWNKNPQIVDILSSVFGKHHGTTSASKRNLEVALKSWRDSSDGTYRTLKRILDQISVFGGKSPLELASVQNMLPAVKSTVSELSSKSATDDSDSEYKDSYAHLDTKELASVQNMLPAHKSTVSKLSSKSASDDSDSEYKDSYAHLDTKELASAALDGKGGNLKQVTKLTDSESTKTGDSAIQELKIEYTISDEQLSTKIKEKDIFDLAGCFDCVETYLDKLGLTASQQTQVEDLAERRDVQIAMTKALKFWRQPKPWLATYRTLLQILLDLRRGDVAVRVCQYIKQEVPKQR